MYWKSVMRLESVRKYDFLVVYASRAIGTVKFQKVAKRYILQRFRAAIGFLMHSI